MRMGGVLILARLKAAVESLTLTEAAACSLPGPRCLAQGCLGSELKGAAFVKTHLSDCVYLRLTQMLACVLSSSDSPEPSELTHKHPSAAFAGCFFSRPDSVAAPRLEL